jgi:hypothetical protein
MASEGCVTALVVIEDFGSGVGPAGGLASVD